MKKLSYGFIKEYIEQQKGFKLISSEYIGVHDQLIIKCDKCHLFKRSYIVFQKSKECPICEKLYYFNKVKEKLKQINYKLLSEFEDYKTCQSKLKIQCDKGHIYETQARIVTIQNGLCPKCNAIKTSKRVILKHKDVQLEIENNNGFKLLSRYIDSKTKIEIKCPEGHSFFMKYNDFIKNPICPKCNNLVNKNKRIYFNKLTYEQVKQEIEIDGYKLISKQYVKSSDKLQIQCPLGHIFNMSHHSFKSGTRCPKCYQLNCTPSNKKTMEQLKKDIFELVGNEYEILSKKYLGNKTKILMKHNSNKCNYNEFEVIPSNFLQGTRCPKCGKLVKKDYDEVKQIVENLGFKYVDKDYKGVEYKFTIKDIYGYYYITSLVVLNMGSIPIKVSTNNPYSIQNIKLWLENTNKEFELLEDIYSKPNQKLKWKCLRNGCGEIFIKNWTGILNGIGCPYCNGKLVGKNNNLLKINPEICKEWNYEKNDKLPSEYMPKSNKKVWWKCNECNHEWQTTISHRSDSRGCPRCNISKGEKKVKYFLEDNKSVYEPQYEFINLLSDLGNPLRFDFAIFKDKEKTQLKMLIEYDGEGHYSAKPFGKKSYKSTIYHDKRKNKYCKLNNIPLLRIPYWDFDNIEQILEKVILC